MWLLRLLVVLIVFALCSPAETQQRSALFQIGWISKGNFAAATGLAPLGY